MKSTLESVREKIKIKWWEYLLLWFIKPSCSMDITEEGAYKITYKRMFGKTYFVRSEWK